MARPPLPIGSHGKITCYEEGPKQWRAYTKFRDFDGVTRRVARSGRSKAAAERTLKQALAERGRGTTGDVTSETKLKAVAEPYLDDVRRRRRGTTYDTYSHHMANNVLPALGELRLREVTVVRIEQFLRSCEARLKPNTVRTVRTVLSGVLGYAVRCGALAGNPTREVGRIEGDRNLVRALIRDERVELLAKLDADEVAGRHDIPDLVRFMMGTGCRIGEAIAVQDDAIDWDEGTVSVEANLVRVKGVGLVRHEGKTFAAHRVLPLPQFVIDRLASRRPFDVAPDAVLFPNSRGYVPGRAGWRDPHNTGARLRDALRRAGFEWVTSHVFRKTAATVLDEARLTARAIAGHIGHARPSITQDVYMDKRAGSREAADVLDAAYRSE
jgi:integrase